MRIAEIKLTQKKNLGNYESLELGLTAIVEESDSPSDSIEKLRNLIDWELNKNERQIKFEDFQKQLLSITDEKRREQIERWIEKFTQMKNEIEKDWGLLQSES